MHFIQIGDWIFDTKAQQIRCAAQTTQLEPISSLLLLYFCQNCERIITRDDLIAQVWNNRVVSDSTINRAISMLRKHLGDDPQKPSYIRTVHKQGYLLLVTAATLSKLDVELHQKKAEQGLLQSLSFTKIVILLFISTISFLAVYNLLIKESSPLVEKKNKVQPVISTKGQQRNIVLSHNEKWLLYSHKSKGSKFDNLYIKNLHSGKINRLTQGEFNDLGASFSFDDSEIYFARIVSGQSCKIMHIDLVGFTDHLEEEIVSCNERLHFNKVSTLINNQEILFRDFRLPRGFAVYRYHLKNKTYREVTKIPEQNTVEWYQNVSPDGKWLAMFHGRNSITKVLIVNLTNTNNEKVIFTAASGSMKSISWAHDSQSVYVKDRKHNQLLNINIHSTEVTAIDVDSQLLSFFSNQSRAGLFYALYGLKSQRDVIAIDLQNEDKEEILIESSANDKLATQLTKDKLFFVSDRSGFDQFYLRGQDNIDEQLTKFSENIVFSHFDVHPNGVDLIGMADSRLFTFNIENRVFTWLSDENPDLASPFYNETGDIFYLKYNKYQQNLYRHIGNRQDELVLEDVGIAQWVKNQQGEEDLLYQKSNGVVYRYIVATKQTLQESYGLPYVGAKNRMWLGTPEGIYFLRSYNFDKRGIYFKPNNTRERSMFYATKDSGVYNLFYDRFNNRLLMEKPDNDMLTKVVKIDLSNSD